MKKETTDGKVVKGKLIAEKEIALPNGQNVKVKLVDCIEPRAPQVPKAAWGTAEFADELDYFEAPKALQARVRKVLDKSVTDLIDTVETVGSRGARAIQFWNNALCTGGLAKVTKPMAKLAIMNAKTAVDMLEINLLVMVRGLIKTNLKAEWAEKDAKKAAKPAAKKDTKKAAKPATKKGE